MKALVHEEINKLPVYKNADLPSCEPDESLIQIKAAALNHRDYWIIKGQYAGLKYPIILGSDGAGLLDNQPVIINPNVNWGDNPNYQSKHYNILGLPKNGTFAEFVAIKKSHIHPIPDHLNFEQAAALPIAGMTSFRALFVKCNLKKTDKVLINGVGGGVALMAFQMANAIGAQVFVTSGDDDKIDKALKMGAVGGVNYTTEDWSKNMQTLAGGFDVIIDSAAGNGFNHLIKLCNPSARICIYGGTRGAINNISPQPIFWKQISILGSTMSNDTEFVEMLQFVEKHKIVPVVDSVFKFSESDEAFKKLEQNSQFGKIVLVP